ncbi:hypothetical protein ACGFYQ_41590 [Streptomyces sp. NPDC048258]|uniref:hypothetical protein n=1 Tax=Streptomyces sp. NPDC048258 TaxID=3365527 RepID=UPI003714BFAF
MVEDAAAVKAVTPHGLGLLLRDDRLLLVNLPRRRADFLLLVDGRRLQPGEGGRRFADEARHGGLGADHELAGGT